MKFSLIIIKCISIFILLLIPRALISHSHCLLWTFSLPFLFELSSVPLYLLLIHHHSPEKNVLLFLFFALLFLPLLTPLAINWVNAELRGHSSFSSLPTFYGPFEFGSSNNYSVWGGHSASSSSICKLARFLLLDWLAHSFSLPLLLHTDYRVHLKARSIASIVAFWFAVSFFLPFSCSVRPP